MKKIGFVTTAVIVVCAGCGVFQPRTAESPDSQAAVNQLEFEDILGNGTNERFSKLAYEDLFSNDFEYISAFDLTTAYDKASLINRLRIVEAQYGDSVRVIWAPDPNRPSPISLDRINPNTLYRIYKVILTAYPPDTISGDALFRVGYDDMINSWRILYWKDTPEEAPGIFNPGQ